MDKSISPQTWDGYVERWAQNEGCDHGLRWPGDEWGNPDVWERNFAELFVDVESWQRAVEIGQGSGKYTSRVLEYPEVSVRAYDVSARFLEVCGERCAEHVDSGRLSLREIDTSTPRFLLDDLGDWRRSVDALYALGTFVHIDLQYATAYLLTAAAVLRPGGQLILHFGNVGSDHGFTQLLRDVRNFWHTADRKYEWVSGSLIASLLPRLGFDIDLLLEPEDSINLSVVATLARPAVGDELVRYLL